jgi:hypothetical protein
LSHLVTIQTQIRDPIAIRAACKRLGLDAPVHGQTRLFDGATPTGWQVNLPGWQYPVVCQADGTLAYDNYKGRWGELSHLDRFRQAYAVEKATLEAKCKGYRVAETAMPDGSIRLTVNTGG